MPQAFRFKLMRAPRLRRLHRLVEMAGVIWNYVVALEKRYYRRFKKRPSVARLQAQIAQRKRRSRPEWTQLNSQAAQAIVDRWEAGWQHFFEAHKNGRRGVRPPGFRKLARFRSITLKQSGWKLLGPGKLVVQGQTFRFHQSRAIEGTVKTVTLRRDALGEFFVSFSCENVPSPKQKIEAATRSEAGFDFGLRTFLRRDDGKAWAAPLPFTQAQRKVRKASRALSRKARGSRGRRKARATLGRLHRRLANVRTEWQWKAARGLVVEHDLLVFEDLALTGMCRRWGRKMHDLGFAEFVAKVKWMAVRHGRQFIQVGRYEPTSKRCSCCGHKLASLPLVVRAWNCPQCGTQHDRDINAAKNILEAGRRLRREESVSPVSSQAVSAISAESHGL